MLITVPLAKRSSVTGRQAPTSGWACVQHMAWCLITVLWEHRCPQMCKCRTLAGQQAPAPLITLPWPWPRENGCFQGPQTFTEMWGSPL